MALSNESSSSDVPVEVVGQFSVTESLGPNLENALHFGTSLAAAYFSHQSSDGSNPVIATSESTDAGLVRSLVGLKAWNPSYLLGHESLTVATKRSALVRTPSGSQPENLRLKTAERRYFAKTSQLIWLDAVRLRELFVRHGQWISGQIAPASSETRERVQTHLGRACEVLKLFDAAFIAAKFDEDHVRLVVGAALDQVE
jgi:hypothetical protein